MKRIRFGYGLMALILSGAISAQAQFWNAAVQATESVYDDRNAVMMEYMDQIWLFWDRDMGGDRQIFYRILSPEGQIIGDEIQLTFGPGSNFGMRLTGLPPLLCWEHQEEEHRDVLFTYLQAGLWSPIMIAFDSERNEYAPWPAVAYQTVFPQTFTHFIITAQEDSAILVKDWKLENGQLHLMQSERWPMPGRVEFPSCAKPTMGWQFLCMWQLSLAADTLIQWRNYDGQTGWGQQYNLQVQGLQAFNPFLRESTVVYFNYIDEGIVKIAQCFGFGGGEPGTLIPDIFDNFNGNQFDPSYHDLLVFYSDMGGDFDVYCGDPNEPIGSSDSSDVNPYAIGSELSQMPSGGYFCYLCTWESKRNGNWDIYYSVSDSMLGVNDSPSGQAAQPNEIELSVHPNPGNAEFRIDLEAPAAGLASVQIFDLSGRLVDEAFNGWLPPGRKLVDWNGRGKPSGIYWLRFQAGDLIASNKIVLLK